MEAKPSSTMQNHRPVLSRKRKTLFALIVFVAFYGILEAALRLSGFENNAGSPTVVIDGVRQASMFQQTSKSNWKPEPGKGNFNQAGFLGPVLSRRKPQNTLRVATLGDSCTHWGDPPYPARLQKLLEERLSQEVQVLNAGVTGYSTVQGLTRLDDVLPFKPDIVTIYFGWNDHWLWRTQSDRDAERRASFAERLFPVFAQSRVVQAGLLVKEAFGPDVAPGKANRIFRVPLEEYSQNLRTMIATVRANDALPILITAPTDLTPKTPYQEVGILEDLPSTQYHSAFELHFDYVQATRKVAADEEVALVDAYASFGVVEAGIKADHIHLTDLGMDEMARLLADAIVKSLEK